MLALRVDFQQRETNNGRIPVIFTTGFTHTYTSTQICIWIKMRANWNDKYKYVATWCHRWMHSLHNLQQTTNAPQWQIQTAGHHAELYPTPAKKLAEKTCNLKLLWRAITPMPWVDTSRPCQHTDQCKHRIMALYKIMKNTYMLAQSECLLHYVAE